MISIASAMQQDAIKEQPWGSVLYFQAVGV